MLAVIQIVLAQLKELRTTKQQIKELTSNSIKVVLLSLILQVEKALAHSFKHHLSPHALIMNTSRHAATLNKMIRILQLRTIWSAEK
jgi:hypothetical protein